MTVRISPCYHKCELAANRFLNGFQRKLRAGVRFSSRDGLRDFIRLSFVFYEPDEIEEGIVRLKKWLE